MKKKFARILGVSLTLVLLVSLALSAAVMATVSEPKVTVVPEAISTAADYEIKFDAYFPLTAGTSTITIEFPANTTVPAAYVAGSITVTAGGAGTAATTVTTVPATRKVEITVPAGEGTVAAAHVVVDIAAAAGIINPSTPGTYSLEVKTSEETTAVESKTYTIGVPGMVTRLNDDGNFVGSYTVIQDALDICNAKDTIRLGAGTYTEDINIDDEDLTIEGSADAADVIIKGSVTLDEHNATLDNLTVKGMTTASADGIVISNCILEKKDKATETLLTITGDRIEVADCNIDTTYDSKDDVGILVSGGDDATIVGCTFTTDEGSEVSPMDKAIEVDAASAAVTDLEVKECTFTGTKGTGYYEDTPANSTDVTVKDCTFDALETAFFVDQVAGSELVIQNNMISNQDGSKKAAIDVDGAVDIIIVGNTIEDGEGNSIHVSADAHDVVAIGNSLVGNEKGVKCTDATNDLVAENNWWGDASGPSGEGTGDGDAVSLNVDYKPYLGAPIVKGQADTGKTGLTADKTAGVKLSGLTSSDVIWLGKYASNPKDVDPKYSALADTWYDVYVKTGVGTATLKLYGDGITKNTDAYVWSGLENKWVKCSEQGASASGGYVWVMVSATTTPSLTDLGELPFVLVAAPEATPDVFVLNAPEAGATVALTNVPFTWASVAEAESYELVISANADMSSPMVKVSAAGTAYTYTGNLADGTPYYWQVTAMKGTAVEGKSDVGTFVAAAPVEPTPPVVIEPAPPPVIEPVIEIPPSPLTPGVIWAIIAIGAILVIAVIVLIVRTRRVT